VSYNEWLDIDVLEDYLDGKLDAKTMHKIEKLSLDDPFVAEALAGLSQSPKRTQTLSLLQKQLKERIAQKPVAAKRWRITSQRLSIAAAAAVLFVAVSILFWMKENNRQQFLAEQNKKVDINIAPKTAAVPFSTDTVEPSTTLKTTTSIKQGNSNQMAKARSIASTADRISKPEAAIAVAKGQPIADSVMATFASINGKVTERKQDEQAIAEPQQSTAALKKAEVVRERALPGKAKGIHVETNPGLRNVTGIINGRVYAKNDGLPLPGAIVKIAGTNKATTTNTKGEFTLPADSSTQSLSIAYLGFTSKEIKAQANQEVSVGLEEANAMLNEVAVMPKGDAYSAMALPAYALQSFYYPIGGWEDYQAYLKNNNGLTKDGLQGKDVELKFEVKDNGSPTKIVVVKSQGKLLDKEAVRLLKDGPKWIPSHKDKRGTAQLIVKF
jgi:hypothetical protein